MLSISLRTRSATFPLHYAVLLRHWIQAVALCFQWFKCDNPTFFTITRHKDTNSTGNSLQCKKLAWNNNENNVPWEKPEKQFGRAERPQQGKPILWLLRCDKNKTNRKKWPTINIFRSTALFSKNHCCRYRRCGKVPISKIHEDFKVRAFYLTYIWVISL